MRDRLRLVTAVLAALCASSPSRLVAQALPPAGSEDLTVPPELRDRTAAQAGAPVANAARPSHTRAMQGRRVTPRGVGAAPALVTQDATNTADHPVDLGVTMRGGSGTPRVHAATGASEAVQESGAAFGAAMKFGF